MRGRVPDGGPLSVFSVVSSAGQSNCLLSSCGCTPVVSGGDGGLQQPDNVGAV